MQRRSFISLASAAFAAPALPALPAAAVANPASQAARTQILIRAMFHPRAAYRFSTAEVAAKARISEADASRAIKGLLDEGYIVGSGRQGHFAHVHRRAAQTRSTTREQRKSSQSRPEKDALMAHLHRLAQSYFAQKAALA